MALYEKIGINLWNGIEVPVYVDLAPKPSYGHYCQCCACIAFAYRESLDILCLFALTEALGLEYGEFVN